MSNEPDAFESAEYYTARDSDKLSLASPEEAIEEVLDREMLPGCDVLAIIDACSPVTVRAYDQSAVSDEWVKSRAESLLDQLAESFADEYGDPNGVGIDPGKVSDALPAMMDVVRGLASKGHVWRCECVGEREYDADEVEALMREHCPEWFEKSEVGK